VVIPGHHLVPKWYQVGRIRAEGVIRHLGDQAADHDPPYALMSAISGGQTIANRSNTVSISSCI
jgi:hypothetical protein